VVDTGATDGPYPADVTVFDINSSGTGVTGASSSGLRNRFHRRRSLRYRWQCLVRVGLGGMDTNGVRVHAPDGTLLAFLHTPEVIANLVFGGTKRNRLVMTGSTSIYAIYVNTVGAALS
jgi:gluconolactonase